MKNTQGGVLIPTTFQYLYLSSKRREKKRNIIFNKKKKKNWSHAENESRGNYK